MSIDPTFCAGSAYSVPQATCELAPAFTQFLTLLGDNSQFEVLDDAGLVTSDDYDLTMIHFTADSNGDPVADQGSKGPILLLNGLTCDERCWFKPGQSVLPEQLFFAGYDVYIGSKRGQNLSRTHRSLDPANEDYWNFTPEDVGLIDYSTMISYIHSKRSTDGDDPAKLKVLAVSYAFPETAFLMNAFPGTSSNYVDRIVSQSSCPIPLNDVGLLIIGDPTQEIYNTLDTDRRRRQLKHKSKKSEGSESSSDSESSCSDDEFKDEVKRIKYEELDRDEYRMFYRHIKEWQRENKKDKSVYCQNGGWEEAIVEALCKIDVMRPECQPATIRAFEIIRNTLRDNGIYTLWGPDWDTQVPTICGIFGATSSVCGLFTVLPGGFEVPLNYIERTFQSGYENAFIEDSDTWYDSVWYSPTPTADISNFNVPLYTTFSLGDSVCAEGPNSEVIKQQVSTLQKETLFTYPGVTHGSVIGTTEEPVYSTLLADLGIMTPLVSMDLTECTGGCDVAGFPWVN